MEFKGTKGKLEPKYVSGICIGIGTIGQICKMTANSILSHIETDDDYEKEKVEIEADMLIYSKAPEMLEILKSILVRFEDNERLSMMEISILQEAKQLIKEATEL